MNVHTNIYSKTDNNEYIYAYMSEYTYIQIDV